VNKKIHQFNQSFTPDFVLQFAGAVPNTNYKPLWYGNSWLLYYEYNIRLNDGLWYPITVQTRQDGGIQITSPTGNILTNPFEFYCHFVCNNNYDLALDWEKNASLFNGLKIRPLLDINSVIDLSNRYQNSIDLVSCVIGFESRTKRLAQHLSEVCHLPMNTVMLLLLGGFSAMTSKRFNCAYEDGKKAAINLYVIAEQSSGTSKTRFQAMTIEPMVNLIRQKMKTLRSMISETDEELIDLLDYKDTFDAEAKLLRRKLRLLRKELLEVENLMPITNGTPESLEDVLNITNGIFSAISSEQGLLNSMLGLSYGKKTQNHDILLNARDGGEVKSNRVSRVGYSGYVLGTLVCFAQEGTIAKMVQASNVTGLFERCLVISELDMIGYRDHLNSVQPDAILLEEYEKQCHFFEEVLNKRFDHERLVTLRITAYDWTSIHHFENEMESQLVEGMRYSHPLMRRFISKSRMQIMGLASNLYLLDVDPSQMPSDCYGEHYIPSEYVMNAIYMMRQLIDCVYSHSINNGIINNTDQLKVVYDLFAKHGALTMQEIKKKCEGIKPFKDLKSPRWIIETVVHYLARNYVLLLTSHNAYIRNPEPYYPM
jgi:hypothetical protein